MSKSNSIVGLMLPLAALFTGCSSESFPEDLKMTEPAAVTETAQVQGIRNYLNHTHKGTRAGNYQLIPYVEDGDTIMYVAQYENGWELFSNSFTAPMSLMKCETGQFSEAIAQANPAFLALYDGMVSALKENRTEEDPDTLAGADQWMAYSSQPDPVNPPPTTGEGVYTLVGIKQYPTVHKEIPHLLKTKWNQGDHFNTYMPYHEKNTSNSNTSEHILVGCVSVAVGQFLYYSHYKWGTPVVIPSSAVYNSSSKKYDFKNYSTQQWDKMFLYYNSWIEQDPSVPIFLGWIANRIGAKPSYKNNKYKGTGAKLNDACDFIKAETRYPAEVVEYQNSLASSMVSDGEPVILRLVDNDDQGHEVVMDAIDYTSVEADYYYAYITDQGGSGGTGGDPTKPSGPDTGTTDDYNYLVSKYGHIFTERHHTFTSYFKFNWGWGETGDDTVINGAILEFVSPINSKEKFKMVQMIYYTID